MFATFLNLAWQNIALAAMSLILCLGLIRAARRFPRMAGRTDDLSAVQCAHTSATPRVAGLAIFGALMFGILFVPAGYTERFALFLGSASVLFLVSLLEDLGFQIKPRIRLVAAIISSLLVVVTLDVWLMRSGIAWLDPYMHYWPVGVALTVLVTVGVANGFNLIDGVNGLAAVTAIACALALAFIAHQAEFAAMVKLTLMVAFTVCGFAVVNFPHGKIFLGDAGAYTLGFALSWFGVAILVHFPAVSPWAILLTVFWPVADTGLAIYRRARRQTIAFAPDRLHVHQLVMHALEVYVLGRGRRHLANPLTTISLAPFVIAGPLTGALLWDNNAVAGLVLLTYAVGFFGCYVLALPVLRRLPRQQAACIAQN